MGLKFIITWLLRWIFGGLTIDVCAIFVLPALYLFALWLFPSIFQSLLHCLDYEDTFLTHTLPSHAQCIDSISVPAHASIDRHIVTQHARIFILSPECDLQVESAAWRVAFLPRVLHRSMTGLYDKAEGCTNTCRRQHTSRIIPKAGVADFNVRVETNTCFHILFGQITSLSLCSPRFINRSTTPPSWKFSQSARFAQHFSPRKQREEISLMQVVCFLPDIVVLRQQACVFGLPVVRRVFTHRMNVTFNPSRYRPSFMFERSETRICDKQN